MARKLMLPRGIFDQVNSTDKDEWNKTHNNLSRKVSRKDRRKAERLAKKGKAPKSREQDLTSSAKKFTKEPKKEKNPVKVQVDGENEEELDDDMSENETWAALKALKNKKRQLNDKKEEKSNKKSKPQATKPSVDYSNFKSAAELEQIAKDERDAKYYAKMLGQKDLKLKPTENDGLEDILGDLDFDHFSDNESDGKMLPSVDEDAESSSEEESDDEDHDQEQEGESDSEPFIENPWKDDTLSEGDFDTEPEDDSEDEIDAEATMKALAKAKGKNIIEKPKKVSKQSNASKSDSGSGSDSDSEPFIENPWGKDDTLTESDFTDNTDLSGDEQPQRPKEEKPQDSEDEDSEPFIENPWTDDSLSEGDFDSNSDMDDEPMTAEETMALLAKHKKKAPQKVADRDEDDEDEDDSASDSDFDSEQESIDDNMDEDETWAALKALKAKKAGKAIPEPQPPSDDDSASDDDFDSEEESLDDNMDEDETWAALKALKAKKAGGAAPEPEKAPKPKKEPKEPKKENPFLPAVKNQAKYVPPSKRKLLEQQSAESEETIKLRRQLKGIFNKLTEANIGAIINEIEALFETNPKHLVGSLITSILIESVVSQGTLQEAFLIVHSGLVTALYRTIGVNFGAQFIQDVVQEFFKHYNPNERNKDATNVLMLIMGCYSLGMVSSKLIYDFINEFLIEITETNTELLLLVVRTCGSQIRSDDPRGLKEIIITLQKKMSEVDQEKMSVRNKILVESAMNLKNNRLKTNNEQLHALQQRMRKFLGGVRGVATEPLQVTLSDIRNIETKGKWWIVGAAYNSGGGIDKSAIKAEKQADYDEKEVDSFIKSEPNWLALARKQRLNTDIRRAIFIAIMGAEDYMDACIRIDKLRLNSKQDREISHVILHCLTNEKTYNPYYSLVAAKQCTKNSMKKSFQFCAWDYLNQIQDSEGGDIRKAMSYARFYASLVSQGTITLDLLKVVDFLAGNETVRVFLEIFFVFLFKAIGKDAEAKGARDIMGKKTRDAHGLAKVLTSIKEPAVLQGVKYILPNVLESAAYLDAKKKEKERVQWCADMSAELIAQLGTRA